MIQKVPVVIEHSPMLSRKLIGAIAAMVNVNALVLGLALIRPELFAEQPALIFSVVAGILGLGGFQVLQQASIDKTNGSDA